MLLLILNDDRGEAEGSTTVLLLLLTGREEVDTAVLNIMGGGTGLLACPVGGAGKLGAARVVCCSSSSALRAEGEAGA